MKRYIIVLAIIVFSADYLMAQKQPDNRVIDQMLMQGDYEKAIDTCALILTYDTLNAAIYYKMGIAYQNLLENDAAILSFYNAVNLDPDNKTFNLTLAKTFFVNGNMNLAEPILEILCTKDTLNWVYAFYLTSIYMQWKRFDEAIEIYKRFVNADSTNTTYIDKLGYAYLKKGEYQTAIETYDKSLAIDTSDLLAIKNLAYLYTHISKIDTAIYILTKGIEIDPTDLDLYVSRGHLYFAKQYTKRAADDYNVLVSAGDSSKLYLKRIGIGYYNNLQPGLAVKWFELAHKSDTADYETCYYLGMAYYRNKEMKKSATYFKKEIDLLSQYESKLGIAYFQLAESQKGAEMYNEAISSYLKAHWITNSWSNYMYIANIYDEKLNDRPNAIYYYEKYINDLEIAMVNMPPEYTATVRKRLDYLKSLP